MSLWGIACYENQSGCLDLMASNFDVDADEDCCKDPDDCCCEYPDLILNVAHQLDSASLQIGQTYSNNLGQPYILIAVNFFLSDFGLHHNGEWYGIDDSILIEDIKRPNDVTPVSRSSLRLTIGKFLPSLSFDEFRFLCGLSQAEADSSPSQFEDNHPLSKTSNLWEEANGYRMFAVSMIRDTMTMDTVHLSIAASPAIPFDLSIDETKSIGEDLNISLSINYNKWFDTLDLENDSVELLAEKIKEGIKSSIDYLP